MEKYVHNLHLLLVRAVSITSNILIRPLEKGVCGLFVIHRRLGKRIQSSSCWKRL